MLYLQDVKTGTWASLRLNQSELVIVLGLSDAALGEGSGGAKLSKLSVKEIKLVCVHSTSFSICISVLLLLLTAFWVF
jgi:hypothetical protein